MRRISGGRTRRIEDEEEEAIGGWRIRGREIVGVGRTKMTGDLVET